MNKNDYDAIREHLPKDGFLGEYIKFTDDLEACPRFRFFSAVCVMGAAINNKVWLQRGDVGLLPRLMPNIWVMLLGPPYRGHKNSCINMAVNAYLAAYGEDARVLADKLTPESLVTALATPKTSAEKIMIGQRDSVGLIQVPEMSVLFGKQQYNTGMIQLVTDLYDYRPLWVCETIGRGKDVLRNICISVITGSTTKWLASMIPQDAFSGGFMRRFIIIELPNAYYKRTALPTSADKTGWNDIISRFKEFKPLKGEMQWTKEGKQAYLDYYESFTPSGDEQRDAYKEAECEQALKLAMVLDLNHYSLELTADSMNRAMSILNAISPETIQRIQALTTNPRMNLTQEILQIIRNEKLIGENALLKRVYRSLSQGERQFYEALAILKKTGYILPVGKAPNFSYKLKPKGD